MFILTFRGVHWVFAILITSYGRVIKTMIGQYYAPGCAWMCVNVPGYA